MNCASRFDKIADQDSSAARPDETSGAKEMKATINHCLIDYTDHGGGEPLIFLHAFPLNQTMWEGQVADLSAHCRIVTVDLRGFGGSDVLEPLCAMDQMASDVRGLMSALKIERTTLVGLSMGGY